MPLVVAMGLQATFNLVDMVIVGHLPEGPNALSALVICDFVAMIATIFGNGISNATVAIIARRDAEGDFEAVSLTTAQSLSFTIMISIAFGFVGILFAGPMTGDIMGAKGTVHVYATEYMQVIVGGSFSILLLLQLVAILRAVGDAKTPMFLLVGSNILNLFLSVAMVYGPDHAPDPFGWGPPLAEFLGIERGGVVGAAWSTVISRTIAIGIGIIVLLRHQGGLRFPLKWLLPIKKEIMRIWDIAWPNSAQYVVRVLILLFFLAIVQHEFTRYLDNGMVDSSVAAAFAICARLDTITLFTGMGWGGAASTFVGQHLGARMPDRAVRSGWIATGYNCVWMLIVYGLYVYFGEEIISLFLDDNADSAGATQNASIIAVGVEYLTIVGATYIFLGVAVVISSALSGAGATRACLVIDATILLGFVVPLTVAMWRFTDLTPTQTWYLIAIGNLLSAIGYAAWFGKKKWVHKVV
jgi:putative MATE family efflux protein